MRRLFLLAAFIILCASHAKAQGGNTLTINFPGVPSGSCVFLMLGVNQTNGDLYNCDPMTSMWVKTSGSGGSGTINSAAAPECAFYSAATAISGSADFLCDPALHRVSIVPAGVPAQIPDPIDFLIAGLHNEYGFACGGSGGTGCAFSTFNARGTTDSPQPVQDGDILYFLNIQEYFSTSGAQHYLDGSSWEVFADGDPSVSGGSINVPQGVCIGTFATQSTGLAGVAIQARASGEIELANDASNCGRFLGAMLGITPANSGTELEINNGKRVADGGALAQIDTGVANVTGIEHGGAAVGSANAAICWKTTTTLSYCTSVVGAGGTCTCH